MSILLRLSLAISRSFTPFFGLVFGVLRLFLILTNDFIRGLYLKITFFHLLLFDGYIHDLLSSFAIELKFELLD